MTYFAVKHIFNDAEKAQKWWGYISTLDLVKNAGKWSEAGFKNHAFLPSSPSGPVLCIWETKNDMSEAEFQAFIDGPEGPDAQQIGVFTNHVFKMMDGGKAPASYFAKGAPEHENVPNAPGSGSFFWIEHEFVSEEAANKFWGMVSSWTADDWVNGDIQNAANGWFNHVFLPTSPSGNVFCLWESKSKCSVEDMQKFIDGPNGPAPGVFKNTCYKAMDGAGLLPAKFVSNANVVRRYLTTIQSDSLSVEAKTTFMENHLAPSFHTSMEGDGMTREQVIGMWTKYFPATWDQSTEEYNIDYCFADPENPTVVAFMYHHPAQRCYLLRWQDQHRGKEYQGLHHAWLHARGRRENFQDGGALRYLRKHLGIDGTAQPIARELKEEFVNPAAASN